MSGRRPKADSKDRSIKVKALRAVLFLTPALLYLPTFGGQIALPPGEGTYSDLLITHFPNLFYLRDSLLIHQQIPFWSTLIYSGAPFAANPLSGLFYLPGWIAMILPLPAGISLVLAGHAIFGTWGMYRFLCMEGISERGSIMAALVFGLMPKLGAHFGAGHVSLIYAISWTPWLMITSRTDNRGWKTGLAAGLLFLADPRWSIYAGILWASYDLAHRQQHIKRRIARYSRAALIAVLIAAPLILPMIEYLGVSTRAGLSSADMITGSLPAAQLAGLLIPGSGGNLEWYGYLGGAAAAFLVYSLVDEQLRKDHRFWIIWFFLSIFLALGTFGFELDWLSSIPILNLVRVPARSLFISGIVLAVITGRAIDQLLDQSQVEKRTRRVLFGIFAAGLIFALGIGITTRFEPKMAIWGFLFLMISGGVLLLAQGKSNPGQAALILTLVILIDLIGAGMTSYSVQRYEIERPESIQAYLAQEQETFRIYSPSYSLAQDQAALYELELADGIDPMQIAAYADFMGDATGVDRTGYFVTIPPFSTGNPSRDNQMAEIQTDQLGLLNIKYLVSEFPLEAPGLIQVRKEQGSYLYLNERAFPRAWVERLDQDQGLPDLDQIEPAAVISTSPNKILVRANGPGRLVLSEISYPGWTVVVDGEQAQIKEAYQLLRSVDLDAGAHEISFRFRPLSVYAGIFLAAAGWFLAAVFASGKKQ